jgi:hypothetical protein
VCRSYKKHSVPGKLRPSSPSVDKKRQHKMANVITNLLANGVTGSVVGGSGTAIKYFPSIPGSSIGVVSTNNGYLLLPGSNSVNGQRLAVRATGNFAVGDLTGPCPAVTIGLYPVTFTGGLSTASIGSTAIISAVSTTQANISAVYPWALTVDLAGDSASGLVQTLSGAIVIDGVSTSATAGLTSGLTKINFAPGTTLPASGQVAPFGLVVGVTFSVSDTGNTATMFQFDLQN